MAIVGDITIGRRTGMLPVRPGSAVIPVPVVYLPTLASAPAGVWGARRMVSGYSGNLYQLRRASDSATLDVAPVANSDLPDYSEISTWAAGSALFVTTVYDQSGNAKNMVQATGANQPAFDLTQTTAGIVPFIFDGVEGSVAKSLMASTLSIARTNFAYFEAVAHLNSLQNTSHWGIQSSGTTRLRAYTQSNLSGVQINDQTVIAAIGPASVPRAQLSVNGMISTAAKKTYYTRETTIDLASSSAATGNELIVGTGTGATYNARSRRWGMVLYPSLSDTDAVSLRSALISMFSVRTVFTHRIVFDGDSITRGTGAELLKNMVRQLSLNGTPEIFNMAIHGKTMASLDTDYATYIQPLFTSAYGAGKCVLYCNGGINDIGSSGGSVIYNSVISYENKARTDGYTTVRATALPNGAVASGSTQDVRRTDFNTLVRANTAGSNFIADVAALTTRMGPYAATSDLTLYTSDKLHPTSLGYLAECQDTLNTVFASVIP